jgi:hypothetical protein
MSSDPMVLMDAAGRRRSPATIPGHLTGIRQSSSAGYRARGERLRPSTAAIALTWSSSPVATAITRS